MGMRLGWGFEILQQKHPFKANLADWFRFVY
jgi:hypothetical protein